MNLVCVICSELLAPSDDVFHTPCGHIFHYPCLLQWLERSQTCPQCRVRATTKSIHRIYFNFSNNDSIKEDPICLQSRIDNLTFQLKLKDTKINNLEQNNKELDLKSRKSSDSIHHLEREIRGMNRDIDSLKHQIKLYKELCSRIDDYKKEIQDLKENLGHLKNIQNLIDSSKSKLDDVITQTKDVCKLITYIGVLKGELESMREKNKECREKYKNILQKFTCISREKEILSRECAKQKELEEQLMICQNQKIALETHLLDMKEDTLKCVYDKVSAEKQESLQGCEEHRTVSYSAMNDCMEKLEKDKSCIIIDSDSIEDSPQCTKSLGFFSMRDHDLKITLSMKRQKSNNSLKVPSILVKRSRLNQPSQKTTSGSGMSFDGFGGRAKYDTFPNPISSSHVKKTREDAKTSKSKLDKGDNQKISDLLI